ncbi:MAG: hypothetical protein ABL888_16165 [Pirellulaceae bacterium]
MIFFSERQLAVAIREYLIHYHTERNHQGLDNQLIEPPPDPPDNTLPFHCTERLGGLLKFYHRRAA